ncbi:hypothetical protein E6C60_0500 [Paenibacillus algicola]|uniref:Uncharacterized protein n=1 Tax=Paenibacillus algicola TaxID=2565926 RepID=A0A4P8XGH6_9BACL|nr:MULTISPECIES: hypothetical protein [Paenibacillus]QCT01223.1 hypothetical protein E6C60_0500 [Paenibacillus algicola]
METIEEYADMIQQVMDMIYTADPSLLQRYGERGRQKCREDNLHHLKHLETAFQLGNTSVFTDYALWLEGILSKHAMKTRTLTDNFQYMLDSLDLARSLDERARQAYRQYLEAAIHALQQHEAREASMTTAQGEGN